MSRQTPLIDCVSFCLWVGFCFCFFLYMYAWQWVFSLAPQLWFPDKRWDRDSATAEPMHSSMRAFSMNRLQVYFVSVSSQIFLQNKKSLVHLELRSWQEYIMWFSLWLLIGLLGWLSCLAALLCNVHTTESIYSMCASGRLCVCVYLNCAMLLCRSLWI